MIQVILSMFNPNECIKIKHIDAKILADADRCLYVHTLIWFYKQKRLSFL